MSRAIMQKLYRKTCLAVLFAGIIISVLALKGQYRSNEAQFRVKFEKDAYIRSEIIKRHFENSVNNQLLLRAFFENSDEVTAPEFLSFCSVLSQNGHSHRYLWAPEKNGTYNINYAYPSGMLKEYMEKHSVCFDEIKKMDFTSMKEKIVSGYCGGGDIRFMSGVKTGDGVRGVIITTISIEYLVRQALEPMPMINMPVHIYYDSAGESLEVYEWKPRLPGGEPKYFFPFVPGGVVYENDFKAGSGTLRIAIKPGAEYVKRNFPVNHIALFGFLLVLSVLSAYAVNKVVKARETAEAAARETGKKLSELTEDFERFFEIANDMFAFATTEGSFIKVSREWERVLGYKTEELNGKAFLDYVHPEDIEETKKTMSVLAQRKPVMNFVNRYRCKDGGYRYIEWRSVAPEGKLIYASARDITERKNYEKALEEREYWLKESQKAGKIGSYSFDIQGDSWYCTEALDSIFGTEKNYPKTFKSWDELLFKDDRGMMNAYFETLLEKKGSEPFNREYRIKRKSDGAVRWVYGRGDFIVNKGVVEKMIGTISDVTEQVEARLALKSSEELYNSLVETAHDLIWRCDSQGRYIYVNKAWEEALGFTVAEIKGKKFTDFMDSEQAGRDTETFAKIISEEGHVYGYETSHRRKDGTAANLVFNALAVKDSAGNVTGTQGTAQDITLRKKAEEKLVESERKLRSLVDGMAEGVAMHEYIFKDGTPVDYRIVDVNKSYEKILSVDKKKITGKTSAEAYGTGEPPYMKEFLKPYETGAHYIFETYFQPMDRYFSISVAPWGDKGFATIFSDITSRKKSEEERESMIRELEAKNAEMESFLYTVSHDLKTPLVTVSGFSSLLELKLEGRLGEEEREFLGLIKTSVSSMNGLLDGVLTVSRAGRLISTEKNVRMSEVIKDAIKVSNGVLKSRGAVIRVVQAKGAPLDPVFEGDRKKLSEVFQNLITNGVKFVPENVKPEIEIVIEQDASGGTPVYCVKDNGIGIEPKYLSKVFGLFERLDDSVEGTGIGLAIVKRIIELHGGRVWAESEGKGKGSVFKFKI